RLLREHALELGLQPDFRVLNRAEQVIFLRDRLFQLPLERYRPLGDPTRHIRALITLISRCKDEDVSPEEYAPTRSAWRPSPARRPTTKSCASVPRSSSSSRGPMRNTRS